MNKKVKLQLVGLDGNAFSIIGTWKTAARKQGWKHEEIELVLNDAMSSDNNHLLQTIMKYTEDPDEN